jgi:hypothetical protein
MSRKKQIRDLPSLEREIRLLKNKAVKIQHSMDEQVLHLKENAGSMFWNTVVGQTTGRSPVMAVVVGAILNNEKVKGLINKLAGKLADFITKASGSVFMSESDDKENS